MTPTWFIVNQTYERVHTDRRAYNLGSPFLNAFAVLNLEFTIKSSQTSFSLVKSYLNSLVMLVPLFLMAPVLAATPIQKYSIAWHPKSQVVSE